MPPARLPSVRYRRAWPSTAPQSVSGGAAAHQAAEAEPPTSRVTAPVRGDGQQHDQHVERDQGLGDIAVAAGGAAAEGGARRPHAVGGPRRRTPGTGARPRPRSCSPGRSAGRTGCTGRTSPGRGGGSRPGWSAGTRSGAASRCAERSVMQQGTSRDGSGRGALDLDPLDDDVLRAAGRSGRSGWSRSRRRPCADASSATWPKMVCRLFRCGVGATVMKNCEPLVVPGPAFAIASRYGRSKRSSGWNSSSNL